MNSSGMLSYKERAQRAASGEAKLGLCEAAPRMEEREQLFYQTGGQLPSSPSMLAMAMQQSGSPMSLLAEELLASIERIEEQNRAPHMESADADQVGVHWELDAAINEEARLGPDQPELPVDALPDADISSSTEHAIAPVHHTHELPKGSELHLPQEMPQGLSQAIESWVGENVEWSYPYPMKLEDILLITDGWMVINARYKDMDAGSTGACTIVCYARKRKAGVGWEVTPSIAHGKVKIKEFFC